MSIEVLSEAFTFAKITDLKEVPSALPFCFLAATDNEISLVCPTRFASFPASARKDGWRAIRICGKMDFSLVGILSRVSSALAENGIALCAVSTFDTDYFFVSEKDLQRSLAVLQKAGFTTEDSGAGTRRA
jgi:hypothetical protein